METGSEEEEEEEEEEWMALRGSKEGKGDSVLLTNKGGDHDGAIVNHRQKQTLQGMDREREREREREMK